MMLVLAFWQQLQEEQFVSCTCWQKRDFFSPCTCRTSAAFEALPYLPSLRPVGRRASHASQTKGCFGGGWIARCSVGRARLCSSTSQTQKPASPCSPQGVSLPGSHTHHLPSRHLEPVAHGGKCGALGAPSGSTSGRGSVLP